MMKRLRSAGARRAWPDIRTALLVSLSVALSACAPATVSLPPTGEPGAAVAVERPIPYPVFESAGFERAVARGTRTRTGEPGPRYWQQFAEYELRAALDPGTGILRGSGTVRYHNRSPDALDRIVVHLYQNLHAPDAVRNRTVAITEPMRLTRVVLGGDVLTRREPADTTAVGYTIDGTLATLRPAERIRSGDTVTIEFAWSFPVPPAPGVRMGEDGEVFHLAYWYPQIAVYDDISGWERDQYKGRAEFYMGYADYDVAITVPSGWLVSATGELTNAREVLPAPIRQRLANARESDEIVNVVAARERTAGVSTARGARLTWRFRAENVRDFAWNASNRYVWDATHALVRNPDGETLDTVLINALYRPNAPHWERAAEFARHSIEFLSQSLWPYPYPQMTLVEGIITGGMEYPMMTLIGAGATPRTVRSLYSVTVHEIGHMWFPMLIGSDERRHMWMDEGLTVFNQLDAMQDFFPDVPRDSLRVDRYIPLARRGAEVEIMRHGDLYPNESSRVVAAYDKPAKVWYALREMMGQQNFLQAYREFGRRWTNRHPQPWDLFNTFNTVGGRRLDWFWRSWFYESWPLDQAIGAVEVLGRDLRVVIEDRGLVPMPVWLVITRNNGVVERLDIPVEVWLSGRRSYVAVVRDWASVVSVEIDPGRAFPDIDRSNQRWTR